MSLGHSIAHYRIVSKLGAGGMGEVYLATDTKLNRDVALKVLPDAFANDPERLARLQREAKVLASLNHPNIAAIYGVEEAALAMEFVDGTVLSGPVPVEAAIGYALQMADALEYAHEHGVVHRDLKPANVKVTADGVVKLLDFGLAKAIDHPAPIGATGDSPTMTLEATRAGVILGTAAYMSPEQAHGKTADRRADIWSFGAVLYELLAGKPAFAGESISDTLASVLKQEPDWVALPADTPVAVRRLLKRCLTKDRRERLQAIGEARIVLRKPEAESAEAAPAAAARSLPWLGIAGCIGAGVLATIALAALWGWLRPASSTPRTVTHFTVPFPRARGNAVIAISRDGSRMAFKRLGPEEPIYVRRMDDPEPKRITGTEDAVTPEFSPDGQWLAFYTGGNLSAIKQLRKVPVSGGPALTLASNLVVGAFYQWIHWGDDDNILFATGEALMRVPAAGGKPETLRKADADKDEPYYAAPQLLPGGKQVLVSIPGRNLERNEMRIAALNLQTGEKKVLLENTGIGRFLQSEPGSASGYIVYGSEGSLLASAFDANRLRAGPPVPVRVGIQTSGLVARIGVSNAGTLAYVAGDGAALTSTLVWMDRQGTEKPVGAPHRAYSHLRISPDGTRVAVRIVPGEIHVYDLARGSLTPVARGTTNSPPVWTADGKRLLFHSQSSAGPGTAAKSDLVSAPADGSQPPSVLVSNAYAGADRDLPYFPSSVSPDGKAAIGFLGRNAGGRESRTHIWELPLSDGVSPGEKLRRIVELPRFSLAGGFFSPDGRWVTYQSAESDVTAVYMVPYPGPGERVQISTEGGSGARWARNGRELFYRAPGKRPQHYEIMAVDIQTTPTFRAGKPRVLFEINSNDLSLDYDVAPDGRFLMFKRDSSATAAQTDELHVVLNWAEELRRRVPALQ